jgi:hypothetical protein
MKLFGTSRSRAFTITAVFLLCTFYVTLRASSYPGGITSATDRPGDRTKGCTCHCPLADTSTHVTFAPFVADTTYVPGGTYQFTVTVFNESEAAAGVNIAAWKGALSTVNKDLGLNSGQLYQNGPKHLTYGATSWVFKYKAPTLYGITTDTLYATGNAVNGDGSEDNGDCSDLWNRAPKFVINLSPVKRVEEEVALPAALQVSANPSDQVARMTINVARYADALIEITDVAGRVRSTTPMRLNGGSNIVNLATASLPNGIYFVRLRVANSVIASEKLSIQH